MPQVVQNPVCEKLIERAQTLLAFLNEVDAVGHLKNERIDVGSAFLAVKAAKAAKLAPTLPIKRA